MTTITDVQLVLLRSLLDSARMSARSGSIAGLTTAMLQCDLVVEMALRLSLRSGKDDKKLKDLIGDFTEQHREAKNAPELREAEKLRTARNGVMHAAQTPDQHSVLVWCDTAERAIAFVTRTSLQKDFGQVSLAALVRSIPIREGLERALAARRAGDLRKAILCAGGTFQLLRSHWAMLVRPALGWNKEEEGTTSLAIQTMALEVFGGIEGTMMYRTELLPLLNLTMGFTADDLIRLERLLDAFLRRQDSEAGNHVPPPTEADVDFFVERLADVAWRLELRFPEIVRGTPTSGENMLV